MITLDYYDDNTIRTHAVFFTRKKFLVISIVSILMILFFGNSFFNRFINLDSGSCTKIYIFWYFGCVLFLIIFMIILVVSLSWIFGSTSSNGDEFPMYSEHDLTVLKERYEIERIKVLKQHKYNFSIFDKDWNNEIFQEIMCDSFSVDSQGYAHILNCDSDFVFDESDNHIRYHHIVDNRDGHIVTVKELKEKYLNKNQEE